MRTRPLRIEQVVTSGLFSIDGEAFQVDNNIWLIGDDSEVIVIDAAHDAAPIADAVGDRKLTNIVCTHGHNDHINAALHLQQRCGGAPIALHAADTMLWDVVYPNVRPDLELRHGGTVHVAGTEVSILHTPGHSPGGVCLLLRGEVEAPEPQPDRVFGGDTLFNGGPGATGRSNSNFATLIDSIQRELFVLDGSTVVHTGHGANTTIGAESPHLGDWIARGH
jgi:glyoxylase-like metal-dependent hydrolase (beta-lactamase superfamily II)